MRPRRDWEELVRAKLAALAIEPREKREVIEELAAHLEETYEDLRGRGFTEEDAARRSLSEVKDWHDLQRRVQTARMKENIMTNRITQFWLPGLLTFTLSMGLLELVQKFFPQPFILRLDHPPVLLFYVPWLLTLPLAGAIGACLSTRAGGSRRMTLLSSVFPVLPLAIIFLMAIPVGLVLSHTLSHGIVAAAFLTLGVEWVAVPALVLLVGGFLAQFLFSRRSDSRRIASS
jgi:hypothetical protein